MTWGGGTRCSFEQHRLRSPVCRDCRYWQYTGENTRTGREYGECIPQDRLTVFGVTKACSLFEARPK